MKGRTPECTDACAFPTDEQRARGCQDYHEHYTPSPPVRGFDDDPPPPERNAQEPVRLRRAPLGFGTFKQSSPGEPVTLRAHALMPFMPTKVVVATGSLFEVVRLTGDGKPYTLRDAPPFESQVEVEPGPPAQDFELTLCPLMDGAAALFGLIPSSTEDE